MFLRYEFHWNNLHLLLIVMVSRVAEKITGSVVCIDIEGNTVLNQIK